MPPDKTRPAVIGAGPPATTTPTQLPSRRAPRGTDLALAAADETTTKDRGPPTELGGVRGRIGNLSVLTETDPDTLLDAIGLITAQEVVPNRLFINGSDFVTLRKVKEATGSAKYVLEPDLTEDATYGLFGIPVTSPTSSPTALPSSPTCRTLPLPATSRPA